ncbi:MAG: hypothetical protein SGI88_00400 [Candidatus Hydrogenedentes bacterium]|nr:hypothetical protein [Candidatus Hydrogenedentota bacterium]
MKHIRLVSVTRAKQADALGDLYNTVWSAWLDFVYAKKNQIIPIDDPET